MPTTRSNEPDLKGAGVRCPRCGNHKYTREGKVPRGYDQRLRRFFCDECEIGWYEKPGSRSKPIVGDLEAARKAYDPEGRKHRPGEH